MPCSSWTPDLIDGETYTVGEVLSDGYLMLRDAPQSPLSDGSYNDDRFVLCEVTMSAAQSDAVHRPNHYARFKIEPITFIAENDIPFMPGNVIKYVLRHDAKDGIQDLKKARRYLDMMIAKAEGRTDWSE